MLHYWLPLSPSSASRFDPDLWQAYVKANKVQLVKCSIESAGWPYTLHAYSLALSFLEIGNRQQSTHTQGTARMPWSIIILANKCLTGYRVRADLFRQAG